MCENAKKMVLYIRDRSQCVNFVHNVKELREFVGNYIYGTHVVVGDLSLFSGPMRSMLLKFLEDNPEVDCFSSTDLCDPVLLSRFSRVVKDRLVVSSGSSEDSFRKSARDAVSAMMYLDVPNRVRLLSVGCSDLELGLLLGKDGGHE